MLTLERSRLYLSQSGIFLVIATCFCIPLSTSLTGLFSGLVLLFWILSGRFILLPKVLISYPVALTAVGLFLLFTIGMFYTSVDLETSASTLKKYRELLFFPIIISFLMDHPRAGKWAEWAFFSGCATVLAISSAMTLEIIPPHKFGNSLIHHITHSYFMAIFGFWTIHQVWASKRYRILWILLLLAIISNFALVTPGRTGMLVFLLLISLFILQRFTVKFQAVAFLVLVSLAGWSYFLSDNISTRIDEAIDEIKTVDQNEKISSMGNRLRWYRNSITLIQEKPLTGHGTGSFEQEQKRIIEGTKIAPTNNPHNEFFLIGVQLGWIGLLLFMLLLLLLLLSSRAFSSQKKWLLQGMVVSMAAGCLMNSFLYDSLEGHAFVFVSAALLSASAKSAGSLTSPS